MFSEGKITYHNVLDIFGAIDRDSLENLLKSIINRDTSRVIKVLDDILLKKTNVIDFCREFNQFLSDVLKEVILNKRKDIGKEDILQIINLALEMENHVKLSSTPKFIIEFYITKMCYIPKTIDIAKILENLNVVYKQEEKKQTSKINIKEEILNHLQETNKILAGYLSSAEFVEEKEKIKLIFNNEMAFDYVEKNLDNLKKTIELLGYHYEITLENKKSNETKIKLIKELNLEKFNGGDY
jgi:DNA polymerase III gamma/tau subunit